MKKFLYADPSFLSGAARTLDLGAQFDSYNASITSAQADMLAMFADWYAVGQDINEAIEKHKAELSNECVSV